MSKKEKRRILHDWNAPLRVPEFEDKPNMPGHINPPPPPRHGSMRLNTIREGDEGYEPHYKAGCELLDIETIKVALKMQRNFMGETIPDSKPIRFIAIAVWSILGGLIVGFAIAIVLMMTCV